MARKILLLISILMAICPMHRLQGDNCYSEYWQELFWQQWENDTYGLGTYARLETNNRVQNVHSFLLSEQFYCKVSDTFSYEVHYTFIHGRSIVKGSPWQWQHRLELEGNRKFYMPYGFIIDTRNRLELRRLQKTSHIRFRLRQRTMLTIPLKNQGSLKAYSLFNEAFYDLSTNCFTQDRACPCQLTFEMPNKVELNLFIFLRFLMSDEELHKSAVLGTRVNF